MRNLRGVAELIAATGINPVLGILYVWSIVSKQWVDEYHLTTTEVILPYTLKIVIFPVVMVLAGRLQDLKGPRVCTITGGILLGCGLFLCGMAKTPLIMMAAFGVLAGTGIGLCNSATTPTAVKWLPLDRKGLISGIVVAGVGLAAVYIFPIAQTLLQAVGLVEMFKILGITAFAIIMAFSIFLKNPPGTFAAPQIGGPAQVARAPKISDYTCRQMIRTSTFSQYWLMVAFASSAGLMIFGNLAAIAVKQADWKNGFLLIVLMAIFNMLGRFRAASLSDKIGATNTLKLVFFVQAVNLIFFNYYHSSLDLAVGTALAGFCYGAIWSVFPAVTAGTYGIKNLGINYGLVFTFYGLGGILRPIMAGKIVDLAGSYHLAYLGVSLLLLFALAITYTVKSSWEEARLSA